MCIGKSKDNWRDKLQKLLHNKLARDPAKKEKKNPDGLCSFHVCSVAKSGRNGYH